MNPDYVETVIHSFVRKERRARLREFLRSKKRYGDFLSELLHDARHIDPEVIYVLPSSERGLESISKRLQKSGVKGLGYLLGDCDQTPDGAIDDFFCLLCKCVGSKTDSMVYSPSSNVAYYEGHEGFGYLYTAPANTPHKS